VSTIGDSLSKINLSGSWRADEPLAAHTTFRIGGPADAMVFPATVADVKAVRAWTRDAGVPLFVLGRGANLLVADAGIRGVVLNLTSLAGWNLGEGIFTAQAGLDVSAAAEVGRSAGFSCLEFLNAMPSSVGGAVYMNARCYGAEIADVLEAAFVLDEHNVERWVPFVRDQWDYKVSPFQNRDWLIVEARFRTTVADPAAVAQVMETNAADREAKGHFRLPCAGSVFKNNHAYGAPSGVLIDRLGLKGLRRGRAAVSPWHANIFVNEGGATASDLRALILEVKERVATATGFVLEEEVIYAGDWEPGPVKIET
jgi:UDP-N-acetylmuramate dehydrogenase